MDTKNIVIIVGKEKFMFDKKKLCAESKYFENMFNGNFAESRKKEIHIKEVDVEEFRFFNHWNRSMRKSFRGVRGEFLLKLLIFSDRFMVEKLRNQCHENIQEEMNRSGNSDFWYEALETALLIEDPVLKTMFEEWFYITELHRPAKWLGRDLENYIKNVSKFLNNGILASGRLSLPAAEYIRGLTDKYIELIEQKELECDAWMNEIRDLVERIKAGVEAVRGIPRENREAMDMHHRGLGHLFAELAVLKEKF